MSKAFTELKKKSPEDRQKALTEAQADIMKLRAQLTTGAAAKEVGKLHKLKKTIARVRTLQNLEVQSKQ